MCLSKENKDKYENLEKKNKKEKENVEIKFHSIVNYNLFIVN